MSSSPEQSGSATPNLTPLNMSRGLSEASMVSAQSFTGGSGGESPPNTYHGQTLSPPQVMNVLASSSSSTPNSPHLQRPSSGSLVKGMRRKFGRKGPQQSSLTPQTLPPTQEQDSLDGSEHQANKALFVRMLKSWQLQPKKRKHFRRRKQRADKQYHSDDGYTSDPGILREEDDDETDNDPDELRRRLGNELEERKQDKVLELERKADKIRRALEEDDASLHDNEDDLESISVDKPQHKMFRLHRSSTKSKSFYDNQRQKLEKLEAQLKDLREGGGIDSRGSRIRGRIEGSLRGMSLGIKGLGRLRRRKRRTGDMDVIDDVIDDEEDEDEDVQGAEVIITETTPEQEELVALKVDMASLRVAAEEALQQNQKWRVEFLDQQERFGASLTLLLDKLDQERERGDRLEGQLNDITELHQHAVDNLRTQLSQIEHTTTNRCQDFEDAIDEFQSKFNNLDIYLHTMMVKGAGEGPKVNLTMRSLAASLLSFLLLVFAFFLKLTSVIKRRPLLTLPILLVLIAMLVFWYS